MEESKELQGFYKIFRAVIYISVLMEFFEYAIDLAMLDHWGGILIDIHGRIKRWMIYNDGNLVYSKIATFLLICITCIGTRNKKHLEFDARRQVLYPLICGLFLIVFSVWLYHHTMETRLYTLPLNIIFYMAATLVGVILVHIALDNISKFIKEGLGKDRFNFENESFEQSEEKDENQYSVNIPMRYYYKGKFRKGWVSISNCFRGTWVVGTVPDELIDFTFEWKVLKKLCVAVSFRSIIAEQKKEPEMTVRYYISSADLTAEKFATAIRNHWHVENKLHWRLDVVMNEDDCKIRRGNAAELFSGIRHIAINILTNDKVFKAGLRRKMRKAAMDRNYLASVLAESGLS